MAHSFARLREHFLPAHLTAGLISAFRNGPARERSYQGLVDKSLRECQFVEALQDLSRDLESFVVPAIEHDYGVAGGRVNPPVMVYRYPLGVGFTAHHDRVTPIELARAKDNGQPVVGGEFTSVVFLNDPHEYGGGELYFPDHDLEFKPAKGSLVVFPATEEFIHGVAAVTWGERLTVVARVDVQRT